MLTARALDLVHIHRVTIDAHIDCAVTLLKRPAEAARYPLALARWNLVRLLREYHLFKQVEIFEPAIRSGSTTQISQARQMLEACRQGGPYIVTTPATGAAATS